jgi:hypothetical protein
VRHSIEIATSLSLAPIASERVCRPLANLRMLVVKALEYEGSGFGIRPMVEKAEAVASDAPIAAPKTRSDYREGCLPEANEPSE